MLASMGRNGAFTSVSFLNSLPSGLAERSSPSSARLVQTILEGEATEEGASTATEPSTRADRATVIRRFRSIAPTLTFRAGVLRDCAPVRGQIASRDMTTVRDVTYE